jgi:serine protease Do
MKRFGVLALAVSAVMLVLSLTAYGAIFTAVRAIDDGSQTAMDQNAAVVAPVNNLRVSSSAAGSAAAALSGLAAPALDVETEIYETVYREVNPSVVYIENQAEFRTRRGQGTTLVAQSSGSGFIWDNSGHVVTNNHVVEGADRLTVTFADGITIEAELVGTDPDSDLAVIKVDPKLIDLTPVETGDITDVVVGARAIAIGNPYGLVGTMTTGIISAIGRSIPSNPGNPGSYSIPQVIQTDAAINPGNSGGPLLNELGQLIGVNFQITSSSNSNSGIGFAIPVNIVKRVVPALIEDGRYEHAYLGVRGQTYSPAWAEALGFSADDRGAYISEIVANGPAARGGLKGATHETDVVLSVASASMGGGVVYLQSGGDLVIAIDGQPVDAFDDVLIYLENLKSPGDEVVLSVLRANGRQTDVIVTLSARPSATL